MFLNDGEQKKLPALFLSRQLLTALPTVVNI